MRKLERRSAEKGAGNSRFDFQTVQSPWNLTRILAPRAFVPFGEFRESRRGELVLPLRDMNGALHSLQFITPDDRYNGERNKNFLAGGRTGVAYTLFDKADGRL